MHHRRRTAATDCKQIEIVSGTVCALKHHNKLWFVVFMKHLMNMTTEKMNVTGRHNIGSWNDRILVILVFLVALVLLIILVVLITLVILVIANSPKNPNPSRP